MIESLIEYRFDLFLGIFFSIKFEGNMDFLFIKMTDIPVWHVVMGAVLDRSCGVWLMPKAWICLQDRHVQLLRHYGVHDWFVSSGVQIEGCRSIDTCDFSQIQEIVVID